MALKYSFILEAVDRASAITKRVSAAVVSSNRRAEQAARRMTGATNAQARSLEHLQRRAQRMRQVALGRTFQAAADSARRFGRSLQGIPGRLRLMERAGKAAKGALGWLGGAAMGAAKWGAMAAGGAASFAVFDLFKVASQFEQYEVMLEGLTGSNAKAKEAMSWVQDFAKTTPYELDQVMAAFVQLKNYGIDPTSGALRTLGDGASAMNKDLMQAVEMMADAQTGEFERLKEFGIRATKENGKVTFSYKKNGKEMVKVAEETASGIESAILGIFADKFGGGMARQAKTMSGLISNMKDQWSGFLMMVANAGIFDKVKGQLEKWSNRIAKMAEDGRLAAWAENISSKLEIMFDRAVNFIENTDWGNVAMGMGTIVTVLLEIIGLIGRAARAWNDYQRDVEITRLKGIEEGWFTSDEQKRGARRRRWSIQIDQAATDGPTVKGGTKWKPGQNSPSGKVRPRVTASAANSNVNVGGKMEVAIRVDGGTPRLAGVSSTGDVPVKATLKRGSNMGQAA